MHVPRCHRIFIHSFDTGVGLRRENAIEVALDDSKSYIPYDTELGIKFKERGLHTARVIAYDNLSNVSKPIHIDIFVDDITPSFILTPKKGKIIVFPGKEVEDECVDPVPYSPPCLKNHLLHPTCQNPHLTHQNMI